MAERSLHSSSWRRRVSRSLTQAVLAVLLCSPASAADAIAPSQAKADPNGSVLWYDLMLLDIEGKGWEDTKAPYDRLPASAEKIARPPVWGLSRNSAGMVARFVTNAPAVHARWTLTSANLAMPHMPATGVSGLDLYVRLPNGAPWRWLANGRPTQQTNTAQLVSGLPAGEHEFLLYLPLYNGVSSVEIGIPQGHSLAKAPARPPERCKPIVFYGTSITQGGCASRPGMAYTAIVGRRLDRPVINLGFSGNGRMDPELAPLFAQLDPAVFVLDCVPNMNAKEVAERAESFVRVLLKAHPTTPVLLVEGRDRPNAPVFAVARKPGEEDRTALRSVYEKLAAEKAGTVAYLAGDKQLGDDGEATVDNSHPTDLGFLRQADALQQALTPLLQKP